MDYSLEIRIKNFVKDLYNEGQYYGDIPLTTQEVMQEFELDLELDEYIELELLVEDAIEEAQDEEADSAQGTGQEYDD